MGKTKTDLYKESIKILECIELLITDDRQYALVRKKILDLANDIMKCGELDGK